jgi:chloramphenicol O-acetyltransferase type A
MARKLDLSTWERRGHFRLFRDYDDPFFSLTAEVDVTRLHTASKADGGPSYFLATLYASTRAANELEALRLRIRDGEVVVHDVVHPGSTVLRPDDTFTFAYFEYTGDYHSFEARASTVLRRARRSEDLLDPRDDRDDLIHYSVIPWVSFTSFKHARRLRGEDSVPKIVFGRHFARETKRYMPVAIDVHHALADGLHVGRWFEAFQALLDDPLTFSGEDTSGS